MLYSAFFNGRLNSSEPSRCRIVCGTRIAFGKSDVTEFGAGIAECA